MTDSFPSTDSDPHSADRSRVEAVVFDFDGTLVDTETPELVSYEEMFGRYRVKFPVDTWIETVGSVSQFNPYEYLQEVVGETLSFSQLRCRRRERHRTLILSEGVRPGVLDYLRTARTLGLKTAVASSSGSHWVLPLLEHFDLTAFFDIIVTKDDVQHVKPHPALYRETLARLDVSPDRTLAFEDSVNGLKSAYAAGVRCVIVPNPVTERLTWPPEIEALRLATLADLPLGELLELINAR